MTTAPDLPLPVASGTVPAQPLPADARPPLALVPPLPVAEPLSQDSVAFDAALGAAAPRLQRYATRRLQDPHEAEEVVQEALLRAFQHRATFATEDDLMAWLTVVTGRLTIDRLRVRGRATPVAELPPQSRTGRDTADVVVAREEARIALDALEAMPSRQATVLWAREVEGLTYDEIGERYGLSEPTVRSLLHRARKTLRREYEQRGGTFPAVGLLALAPWLHGLRLAGRLRAVIKRTGATATAAGAGLAIATISPLWSSPAPAHAHAAPMAPYVANAEQHALRNPTRIAPRNTVTAPSARTQSAAPATHTPVHIAGIHHACTNKGYGVSCTAPAGPTLYLQVLNHDVGLTNDIAPVSCTTLPKTPLTHCEPSDRKN